MNRVRTIAIGALLGAFLVYPVVAPGVQGEPYDKGDALRGKIATDVVEGNVPVLGEGEIEEMMRAEAERRRLVIDGEAQNVPVLPDPRLTEEQVRDFQRLDQDRSGYISRFEARRNQMEREFEVMDRDDNRRVDLTEFSAFEVEDEGDLPAHTEGLDLHQGEEVSVPTLED
ncbi:penta-EF hand family protein [Thiohalomonas denitrificans]|uniref:EF hand n=1 Tax=Thiohalomonas denitrificans TaxID=415747 RepID=A0A1G5QJH6_9GAMM|nr:EF-hand domain-containing protein [Thiohalomonas denitrificans]SCZ61319.1 hypothetical protein SAMN03097708_02117 [Thiohalomonas denitrificans]